MLCHWSDSPPAARNQVERVADALGEILGSDYVGLYLHGSLAMGCFNPQRSDLDLIAVTRSDQVPVAALTELFLDLSNRPSPLEFHLLWQADLAAWRFPTPFLYHYSEAWRERYVRGVALSEMPEADPDLAAHLTILRHRGVVLTGPPVAELFPAVEPADYLTAIWECDTRDAVCGITRDPVNGVLNLCRVLAYAADRQVTSKVEGGLWALSRIEPELRPMVSRALAVYRGEAVDPCLPSQRLVHFAQQMTAMIDNTLRSTGRSPD